jgi:hypothetical protein
MQCAATNGSLAHSGLPATTNENLSSVLCSLRLSTQLSSYFQHFFSAGRCGWDRPITRDRVFEGGNLKNTFRVCPSHRRSDCPQPGLRSGEDSWFSWRLSKEGTSRRIFATSGPRFESPAEGNYILWMIQSQIWLTISEYFELGMKREEGGFLFHLEGQL